MIPILLLKDENEIFDDKQTMYRNIYNNAKKNCQINLVNESKNRKE